MKLINHIWTGIHNKNWNTDIKNNLFLLITTSISAFAGFILWFALHFFVLNKISWAVCFIIYPGFLVGFLGGILYLYQNDM